MEMNMSGFPDSNRRKCVSAVLAVSTDAALPRVRSQDRTPSGVWG